MMTTLKNLVLAVVLVAGGLGTTACYDAGERTDCVGFSCPTGLYWPEAGEVRIQYIRLPDGTDLRYVTSFFIEEQDPEISPLPPFGTCGPQEDWNDVELRRYLDVGPELTVNMGDFSMTASRQNGVTDFIGRTHDIAYFAESYEPATADFFNAKHPAALPPEMAGEISFSDKLSPGVFVPPQLEVLSPPNPGGGVISLKRGEPLVLEWQEIEEPAPGITTGGVIVFDSPDQVATLCVVPNSGHFVVPADVIDNLSDSGGIMQVGTGSNEAVLTEDGRIIHMWGSNCSLFPWNKVD